MITISDLGKRYGPKALFDGVTLQLVSGHRYGLVGANGSGKSTFLKVLTGDEQADDGQINFPGGLRFGFLRQDQFQEDAARIVDVAMRGDEETFEALSELERLSHDETASDDESASRNGGSAQDQEDAAHKVAELSELIERNDGYTLEARAREILVGVGIPAGKLEQPLATLSGGFKLRVLLAQVLCARPDVLLLDEPTNHLDILSIRWLEGFLRSYEGCAVIISHDRRFLDSVATKMLDVDYETILEYPGNYTDFVVRKEENRLRKDAEIERAEKIIAEKKAFVERFKAKATKARQAQSRVKQIEKIEVAVVARSSRRSPLFKFAQVRPTGKDVLQVEGVKKAYGEHVVLSDVSFSVRRGERIALIGENGIGKSTLLKIITDHLDADAGTFEWGVHAKLGYFAQDHHELLNDPKLTPLDFVWNAAPQEETSAIRGQLGRMLLSGDEVDKKVTTLSGGEAARLVFARICVEQPNILILDEPTNHLDIEAIEALAESLRAYEGTLIFVSHDRWFVSKLATRIIELKRDGLHDFTGSYEEYLAKDGADHLDAETVSLKAKSDKAGASVPPAGKLDHKEQRRRANRLKSLPKKRDQLLEEVEVLEEEKSRLQERYTAADYFSVTPPDEQALHREEEAALTTQIDAKMAEWEAVEEELAELSAD